MDVTAAPTQAPAPPSYGATDGPEEAPPIAALVTMVLGRIHEVDRCVDRLEERIRPALALAVPEERSPIAGSPVGGTSPVREALDDVEVRVNRITERVEL